ncbi:MAG: GTPase [Oscillospiraceae bacterium]
MSPPFGICSRRNCLQCGQGANRPLKIMVVGIPNVGKSTFINQISGRKGAKAENHGGVHPERQWVTVDENILLWTLAISAEKFEGIRGGGGAHLATRGGEG